jgi:PhnB protein
MKQWSKKNNQIIMTDTTNKNLNQVSIIKTSITPWLSVRNCARAVDFYKAAFGAIETYRLESPDGGLVVRLSVDGADFWVGGESAGNDITSPESIGGGSVRMILTVANPDALFTRALKAGASQVYPVSKEHGWRLGRLADPFGLH